MKTVYKFEDFKTGAMTINGHDLQVEAVIHSKDNNNVGHQVRASLDGAKVKTYQMSNLCKLCEVDYATSRTGSTSGTKVVSTKTEEERIAAKARLAFKDAAKGLEAMEAAGLLSEKALKAARKDLEAKIKAEEERLTKEAVAEKARKAEEAEAKKAAKAAASKFEKAAKALDALTVAELMDFIRKYQDNRLAK